MPARFTLFAQNTHLTFRKILLLITVLSCMSCTGDDAQPNTDGTETSGNTIQDNLSAVIYPSAPIGWEGIHYYYTDLQAVLVTPTPEADVSLNYVWHVNDKEPIATETQRLSAHHYSRGDQVRVEIQIDDGVEKTSVMSELIDISSPEEIYTFISPSTVEAGLADLKANVTVQYDSANSFKIDNLSAEDINIEYKWKLNGVVLPEHTTAILPKGLAKYPDTVSVDVVATIGNITKHLTDIFVPENSPAELVTGSIPLLLVYGKNYNFPVFFSDPDGEEVNTTLISAPPGFTYNDETGTANWTPTPLMLTEKETFTATFESSDGAIESVLLNVLDQTRQSFIYSNRTGQAFDINYNFGEAERDSGIELLSAYVNSIFSLKLENNTLNQHWYYPYPMPSDEYIIALQSHGKDHKKITVVTNKAVHLIESRSKPPIKVFEYSFLSDAVFEDFNNDNVEDVALVSDEGDLFIISTDTWQTIFPKITLTDAFSANISKYRLAVGNIDTDPSLEIVSSTGEVVDGRSGEIESRYANGFGTHIAVGDIDGNGIDEIIAAHRETSILRIFDAAASTLTASLDTGKVQICDLHIKNADNDTKEEIFAAECFPQGAIHIYDISDNNLQVQQTIEVSGKEYSPVAEISSINVLDIDGNNVDELIYNSSGRVALTTIEGLQETFIKPLVSDNNPPDTKTMYFAGWTTNAKAEDVAVVVLPESSNVLPFKDGMRIGLINGYEDIQFSGHIQRASHLYRDSVLLDSDSDGSPEVVTAIESNLHHISLSDFNTQYLHDALDRGAISSIELDDTQSAIVRSVITQNNKLVLYDFSSAKLLWESENLGGLHSAFFIGDEGSIVASTYRNTSIWRPDPEGYTNTINKSVECVHTSKVQVAGKTHIVCLDSPDRGEAVLTLFDENLGKVNEYKYEFGVSEISYVPDGYLLMATYQRVGTHQEEYSLQLVDLQTGYEVWQSGKLDSKVESIHYKPNHLTGRGKIALTTQKAFYVIE